MRKIPTSMHDAWLSGDFVGATRPMARVTAQKTQIQLQKIDNSRLFASAVFGQIMPPFELPNVKSVEWSRSVGADVAECTIRFYNTAPLPLGTHPVASNDFDQPGYYTYNYGQTTYSSRWGQTANDWSQYLMPDRVLHTYEGYGFDKTKKAERDPHLVKTGVWMIDEVEYGTDGLITVSCRDLGRLLIDHIIFPPVIPEGDFYPMDWMPIRKVPNAPAPVTSGLTFRPQYSSDSGIPYYGKNGSIHGHKPSHAFDDSDSTYWLSVGNAAPHAGYSYEHIEGATGGATISAVTVKVFGGPYRMYVSVMVKGVWQGKKVIPYDPNNPVSAPNKSNITYSTVQTVAAESTTTVSFTHPVANVDAVRITFTNLFNSHIGPYVYRCGVRKIICHETVTAVKSVGTHLEGNYSDYTDIIKYLLACGGFHWPRTTQAFLRYSDGARVPLKPTTDDPFLKSGRIWGDLEQTGTTAYYDEKNNVANRLDPTVWDKKSLMDGIAYIRDIIGFIFYIDETGGAVWRMPNVFKLGNYVGDFAYNAGFNSNAMVTIDEKQTLLGLRSKISSKNIREFVFVGDENGTFGATAGGYNPVNDPPAGLRRVGGWTDNNFTDVKEAQRMADMITMAQAFTWRTDSISILANPAIQIDDQIQIFERISNEGAIHYVKSIRSSLDLEEGKWTYDLETNWLGETPFTRWAFDPATMSGATQEFLDALRWASATDRGQFHISGGGHLVVDHETK